jgi:hypothetical protein
LATEFDHPAEHDAETRGREQRGDGCAAGVVAHLPPESGPILEIRVRTAVDKALIRRVLQLDHLSSAARFTTRREDSGIP